MKKLTTKKRIMMVVSILLAILLATLATIYVIKDTREQITDVEKYEEILGEQGRYKENLVGYNDIFPDSLEHVSRVEAFTYFYYNPWDPNYFGYLVCEYAEADFEEEISRLKSMESTEYKGIYGIEEFPYEVCAVYADKTYGIIYALADRQENRVVYVALEFCNYFTDISYEKKMDTKYLPIGFDAKAGNATRRAFDEGMQ